MQHHVTGWNHISFLKNTRADQSDPVLNSKQCLPGLMIFLLLVQFSKSRGSFIGTGFYRITCYCEHLLKSLKQFHLSRANADVAVEAVLSASLIIRKRLENNSHIGGWNLHAGLSFLSSFHGVLLRFSVLFGGPLAKKMAYTRLSRNCNLWIASRNNHFILAGKTVLNSFTVLW